MQTIDLKLELRDPVMVRGQLRALGAKRIVALEQRDVRFPLPDGRLLRREAEGEPTEWIFYHRVDRPQPATCHFTILSDEQARTRWGVHGLREAASIVRTREYWMADGVGVHVDDVEGLGRFVELIVLVTSRSDPAEARARLLRVHQALKPSLGESVSASYGDLVAVA